MADSETTLYNISEDIDGDSLLADLGGLPKGNINLKNYRVINSANPTNPKDLANKRYVDSALQGGGAVASQILNTTSGAQLIAQNPSELDANTVLNMNNHKIINVLTPVDSGDVVNKAYSDAGDLSTLNSAKSYTNTQVALPRNSIQSIDASTYFTAANGYTTTNRRIDLQNNKIEQLADPTTPTDAVNMRYVDSKTLDKIPLAVDHVNINAYRLTNVAAPVDNQDAATKKYTDDAIFVGSSKPLDQLPKPTGSLDLNNQNIINVKDGVNPKDAINKGQLDSNLSANSIGDRAYTDGKVASYVPNKISDPLQNSQAVCGSLANGGLFPEIQISQVQGENPCALNMGGGVIRLMGDGLAQTDGATLHNVRTELLNYSTNKILLNGSVGSGKAEIKSAQTEGSILYPFALEMSNTSINMNDLNIYNLAAPLTNTHATNKLYVDSADNQRYLNTTPLNSITLATADINANTHKITGGLPGTATTDFSTLANRLDQFAQPSSLLQYSQSLMPTTANQLVPKSYVDTAVGGIIGGGQSLSQIGSSYPSITSISCSNQQLIDVGSAQGNPANNGGVYTIGDMINVLQGYVPITRPLNLLQSPSGSLSMNQQLITGLLNAPTFSGLISANNGTAVTNANKITDFNKITTSFDANNQKLVNLANPSNPQDAMTLGYYTTNGFTQATADTRYYSKTTDNLGTIQPPTSSVGFGTQKIVGLALGTASTDGANLQNITNAIAAQSLQQKIQSTNTFTSVDTTSGDVIISGNNAGVTRQMLRIRPQVGNTLLNEILLQSTVFTILTNSPTMQWVSPNNSLIMQHSLTTSGGTVTLRMTDATALAGNLQWQSLGSGQTNMSLTTGANGLLIFDSGVTSSSYIQGSSAFQYGASIANGSFTGAQIPSKTFNDSTYFTRTSAAQQYQIPCFNATNQLTFTSITTNAAQTALIMPSASTISVDTINLTSGSVNQYITMSSSMYITGSSYTSLTYSNYGYLIRSGSGVNGTGSGSTTVGLRVTHRIVSDNEVDVISSKKVKNSICDWRECSKEVTERFLQIPLHHYGHKDKTRTQVDNFGIFAEELAEIFPTYVNNDQGFAPDIMKHYDSINGQIMLDPIDGQLPDGIVQMIGEEIKEYKYCNWVVDGVEGRYFVYGIKQRVPSVSKQHLFELTTCIVQDLVKQNRQLVKQNQQLEERLLKLEKIILQ